MDGFAETGNALFDKIDVGPYRRSFFSLVTETEASGGEVDRATEKLIKAFALGHPTMVVGNPRTLRFATELGFQDFSPVIGNGYETSCFGYIFKIFLVKIDGNTYRFQNFIHKF